jgi:hypothetical protein
MATPKSGQVWEEMSANDGPLGSGRSLLDRRKRQTKTFRNSFVG